MASAGFLDVDFRRYCRQLTTVASRRPPRHCRRRRRCNGAAAVTILTGEDVTTSSSISHAALRAGKEGLRLLHAADRSRDARDAGRPCRPRPQIYAPSRHYGIPRQRFRCCVTRLLSSLLIGLTRADRVIYQVEHTYAMPRISPP